MALTRKRKITFYKNRKKIKEVIINDAKKNGGVVFGGASVNKQVPKYLRRPSGDVDIIVKNPKKSARRVERKLDRKFKGDFFKTKKGRSAGTYRVRETLNDEPVADYTKSRKGIVSKTKRIGGVKHTTLEQEKANRLKNLRNPKASFRKGKDSDAVTRINLSKTKTRKKKKKRSTNIIEEASQLGKFF